MVLVGYGITTEEGRWDDYQDAKIDGKIAVVLSGVPFNDTVRFRLPDWTAARKIDNAANRGAAGVVFIGNPLHERADDPHRSRLLRMRDRPQSNIPAIILGTAQLEHILFRTYSETIRGWTSPASIPEAIAYVSEEEGKPYGPVELGLTLSASIMHDPLKKVESEHYVTYYFQNPRTEGQIEKIIKAHEEAYKRMTKDMGVEALGKIIYVSFPDWKMKWILTGHIGYGWASEGFIFEVDDGTNYIDPFHETCHLLQKRLNPLYRGPLNEGFATYWGGWCGQDVHELTRENLKRIKKGLFPFSVLLGDTAFDAQASAYRWWGYEESGSINRYMIDTWDMTKYIQFWKLLRTGEYETNLRALKTVYGESPEEIEKEWREFLAQGKSK
jgi:hypothetical protein